VVDDRCLAEHPLWYCRMLEVVWEEEEKRERIAEEFERIAGRW